MKEVISMSMKISPKYKMKLLQSIEEAIWKEYESYKRVEQYMSQWQVEYNNFGDANFGILRKDNSEAIDLTKTLTFIDDELLMQIAVDIGVNTPDFIPVVATVHNIFKVNYNTSLETFKKALDRCYENPDEAVSLANSALESIIKHILEDDKFAELDRKKTLYKLTMDVLKEFSLFPAKEMPDKIKTIGSAILNISSGIEDLRSNNTNSHGKLNDDHLIEDPIYAFFVVNLVSSLGLFLISFYEKKFKPAYANKAIDDPLDLDNLPF